MQLLESQLQLSESKIRRYLKSAPKKYKTYFIPKRSSGRRLIAHPAKELKLYQRIVALEFEKIFTLHPSAMAYRKGLSIKDNAEKHKNHKFLLKMDFSDFFNSISAELFFEVLSPQLVEISDDDKDLISKIIFWNRSKKPNGKLILSVGAPSSPLVSNALMYLFDESVSQWCDEYGVIYTRYADDLAFSTNKPNTLIKIPELIRKVLVDKYNGTIRVNEGKTVFSSKKHNRHITGITLTNEGNISIGRNRKRYIKSLIHKYSIEQLELDDIFYLQGIFSFACSVEPDFKQRMIKKYSNELILKMTRVQYIGEGK